MHHQKRLIIKKADAKDPDFFISALNIANTLASLGYNWDVIEKTLITRIKPYNFSHPDLDLVHTHLNKIHGRSIV